MNANTVPRVRISLSPPKQKAPNRVPFLLWWRESRLRTLPRKARREFAFEPKAVWELAHKRLGEESSRRQSRREYLSLVSNYKNNSTNANGTPKGVPFLLGGERAACEHCLAKRGESSHSSQAMVGERLGAPAIKFVNSTSGRSKPLPYGQAQGVRIFKSKGFEYLSLLSNY